MSVNTFRVMEPKDIESMAQIHIASFQGFFLSFLGTAFLKELYAGILADPNGMAFVAEKDGQLQGFVAGTDHPQGFYKRLLRQRWLRFAFAAIGPALKKPSSIPRLLRAFSRGEQDDVHENCATLMSIAVSPKAQGNGVGKLLVQAFLDEAINREIEKVNLTTDKNDNEAVNNFYQKTGFSLSASFTTPEGREMNEYLIELTGP